jgi:hypothetical protein
MRAAAIAIAVCLGVTAPAFAESTGSGAAAGSPSKGKPAKAPKQPKVLLPAVLKADDSQAPARVDPAMLDRSYRRAQATRNIGLGLAVPGIALSIVGGVVAFSAVSDPNIFDQGSKIFGGAISAAVGLAVTIPGVYFWTTGQDDMDSVMWRRRELMFPAQ